MLTIADTLGVNVKLPNVILLAHTPGGKVITVSRRSRYAEAGLPGGKVEFGENAYQALVREISEELNIELDIGLLTPIYRALESDGVTTTFRYDKPIDITELPIINSEDCFVTAMDLELLCDDSVSPFWNYNTGLVNHIKSGEPFQWEN